MSEFSSRELDELSALTFAVHAAANRVKWYARRGGNSRKKSRARRDAEREARRNLSTLLRMLRTAALRITSKTPTRRST